MKKGIDAGATASRDLKKGRKSVAPRAAEADRKGEPPKKVDGASLPDGRRGPARPDGQTNRDGSKARLPRVHQQPKDSGKLKQEAAKATRAGLSGLFL